MTLEHNIKELRKVKAKLYVMQEELGKILSNLALIESDLVENRKESAKLQKRISEVEAERDSLKYGYRDGQ